MKSLIVKFKAFWSRLKLWFKAGVGVVSPYFKAIQDHTVAILSDAIATFGRFGLLPIFLIALLVTIVWPHVAVALAVTYAVSQVKDKALCTLTGILAFAIATFFSFWVAELLLIPCFMEVARLSTMIVNRFQARLAEVSV